MTRHPLVSFLCSVIVAALAILGCAVFVPTKNGTAVPDWQFDLFFVSLVMLALGVLGDISSLIWLLIAVNRNQIRTHPKDAAALDGLISRAHSPASAECGVEMRFREQHRRIG